MWRKPERVVRGRERPAGAGASQTVQAVRTAGVAILLSLGTAKVFACMGGTKSLRC